MFDFETVEEVSHDEHGVIEEDLVLDESIIGEKNESEGVGF